MKIESKVKAVKEVPSHGNLYLESKTFPEIKDVGIGDKLSLTVEVEVTQLRKPDKWEIQEQKLKPTDVRVNFDMRSIKFPKKKETE